MTQPPTQCRPAYRDTARDARAAISLLGIVAGVRPLTKEKAEAVMPPRYFPSK